MKWFPLGPRYTVVFLPRRMKVKMSPYYNEPSAYVAKIGNSGGVGLATTHLCPALSEELQRINSIGDGAPNDGQPVEYQRRLIWIPEEYLPNEIP
jgi:hypothetical protein